MLIHGRGHYCRVVSRVLWVFFPATPRAIVRRASTQLLSEMYIDAILVLSVACWRTTYWMTHLFWGLGMFKERCSPLFTKGTQSTRKDHDERGKNGQPYISLWCVCARGGNSNLPPVQRNSPHHSTVCRHDLLFLCWDKINQWEEGELVEFGFSLVYTYV